MDNSFKITFLGTNGSCAYNNGNRKKYGSNTLCMVLQVGGKTLVFDAGTGICGLNDREAFNDDTIHIFFSHYHLDHISGLMFYNGIFDPNIRLYLYDAILPETSLYDALKVRFNKPFYPISINDVATNTVFSDNVKNGILDMGSGVSVSSHVEIYHSSVLVSSYGDISHPGGCRSYIVEYEGKRFCYMTDVELADHANDDELVSFCKGVDLIVMDSFFYNNESTKGWGHSTPKECAEFAKRAEVGTLALYHYDLLATDDDIDKALDDARNIFPNIIASYDWLVITL